MMFYQANNKGLLLFLTLEDFYTLWHVFLFLHQWNSVNIDRISYVITHLAHESLELYRRLDCLQQLLSQCCYMAVKCGQLNPK